MDALREKYSGDRETVRTFGSLGVAFKWFGCEILRSCLLVHMRNGIIIAVCVRACFSVLDFMRAFEYTGPFVKMMSVILIDLRWLLLIWLSAASSVLHPGTLVAVRKR